MVFPFPIKEDIFVCVLFGLVWVLTFGATQQRTQLMYNSVVDFFFPVYELFLAAVLLSGTISIPYLLNGCKRQSCRAQHDKNH